MPRPTADDVHAPPPATPVDLVVPPVLPSSQAPDRELRSAGGGRRRAEKGGFVAEVAEDGTVTLHDRPILDLRPPCLRCVPGDVARRLDEWWQDPYEYHRRGRAPIREVWHAPGSTERPDTMVYLPLLEGSFDETGQGSAAEKRRLLEATRDERAEMAAVARRERELVAIRELPGRLDRLWEDRRLGVAERRRLIFELLDECDETPAGRTARATILGWIRRHPEVTKVGD
jgi:hypothetical protein